MAEEAARGMAALRLSEAIDGVRVTAETTIKETMLASQTVRTSVSAFLKGIRYGDPRCVPQADGSIICEVVAGIGLFGDGGLMESVIDGIPRERPKENPLPPAAPKPPEPSTGVIVDCSGMSLRPGLAPKILTDTKHEVYGGADVSREYVIKEGMVGYAKSVDDAKKNAQRVGANPLVVKAVGPEQAGGINVLVSSEDAGRILAADRDARALKDARVIFVLN
jgi:hypothetical protein